MSFSSNLSALAELLGVELDTLDRAIADLQSKGATRQTAIDQLTISLNNLSNDVGNLDLGAVIDDSITDPSKAWSSEKVTVEIAAAKDSILGGAGDAYNTLIELQNAIVAAGGDVVGILSAQAKRVAVDIAQNFTTAEQDQGRANIGAMSLAVFEEYKLAIGDLTTNFVDKFTQSRAAAAAL